MAHDDDDEDTRAILGRRSRFIAMALAGITSAACGPDLDPRPCLSPPLDHTGQEAEPEVQPQPCLAPLPPPQEEHPEPEPQVCLSVLEPPDES
jgi:hypothetical protein